MDNIFIWLVLMSVSVVFAVFSTFAAYNRMSKPWWFFEGWRHFAGYFITCVIGYFIISVRWPYVNQSGILSISDFLLFLAFLIGVLGWWPYLIKGVTEGITEIIKRVLAK